jgi:hypothetical protein
MAIAYSTKPAATEPFRQELDIFARDPNDYYTTLSNLLNNTGAWDQQLNTCFSPNWLVLTYPTLFDGPVNWTPVNSQPFFQGCNGGIDTSVSGPVGYGAVHAAYEADRGLCAARITADAIVPGVQSALWSQFASTVASSAVGCANAQQQWFYYSSYFNESPGLSPDLAPTGGFIVNFYLVADIVVPGTSNANMRFNFAYQWALDDGILTVSAGENGVDVNGGGSFVNDSSLQSQFETALSTALPQGVESAAYDKVSVDLFPPCCPGTYGNGSSCPAGSSYQFADCTPDDSPDNPEHLVEVENGQDGCGDPIFTLNAALSKAQTDGTFMNIGLPTGNSAIAQDTVNVLVNTAEEQIASVCPPNTTCPPTRALYHNWRCVPSDSNEGNHARCEFIPRAKRLNSYADGPELVWTDHPVEEVALAVANPANRGDAGNFTGLKSGLLLYIIALDQDLHPTAPLCTCQTDAGPTFSGSPACDAGLSTIAPSPGQALGALCNAPPPSGTTRSYLGQNFGNLSQGGNNIGSCAISELGKLFKALFTGDGLLLGIPLALNAFEWFGYSGLPMRL